LFSIISLYPLSEGNNAHFENLKKVRQSPLEKIVDIAGEQEDKFLSF